jgi:hypothetical protein
VGDAVDRVEALPVGEPDRHVGLAEDDCACALQALDRERGFFRDVVDVLREAESGRQSRHVEGFLHRHRDAVQRPEILAALKLGVALARLLARRLEAPHHDGVDARIEPLDPLDIEVEELAAADLARTQAPRKLACRGECQVLHPGHRL